MRFTRLTATLLALVPLAIGDLAGAQGIGATPKPAAGATTFVGARLPTVSPALIESVRGETDAPPAGPAGVSSSLVTSYVAPGSSGDSYTPQAFGTANFPYTTVRSSVTVLGTPNTTSATPISSYPWRATGKLWARFGTEWFVCTASLIRRGVLVSAAHCIHNYGDQQAGFANAVVWWPAYNLSGQPYGSWNAIYWAILSQYYNGTDTCQNGAVGVVCNNDIAVIVLEIKNGLYAGNVVGWYAWGWNGWGFVTSPWIGNQFAGQITQLGYPQAIDGGAQQIRTDSVGIYFTTTDTTNGQLLRNITIGSAQTGGSSGGPWLVNFGTPPSYGSEAAPGSQNTQAVVATTSWGFTTVGTNRQGASWFGQNFEYPNASYGGWGAGNIGALIWWLCTSASGGAFAPYCA
jgi:hypothetical protein